MKTVEKEKAKIAASNEETEKMLDDLNDEADAITAKIKAEEEARKAAAAKIPEGLETQAAVPLPDHRAGADSAGRATVR